jgi:hypothetical protein
MVSRPSISSAPAGYRFPRAVIAVAVRWYLRYGLCYRDVEELLAERGIRVDHRSTGGCRRSRRSSSTRPVRPGTRRVIAGLSTRLTSRSPGPWTYLDRAVDPARAGRRRPAVRTARRARPAGRCSPALGPLRATGMQFALPLCEMWHSTQAVGSSATSTRPGPAAHAVGPDAAAVQRIGCFANGVSTTGLGRPGLNRR